MVLFGLQGLLQTDAVLLAVDQVLRQVLLLKLKYLRLVNGLSPVCVLTHRRLVVGVLPGWRLAVDARVLLASVSWVAWPLLLKSSVGLILLRRRLVRVHLLRNLSGSLVGVVITLRVRLLTHVVGPGLVLVLVELSVLVHVDTKSKPKKYADELVVCF